jgi:hypothetical protein
MVDEMASPQQCVLRQTVVGALFYFCTFIVVCAVGEGAGVKSLPTPKSKRYLKA